MLVSAAEIVVVVIGALVGLVMGLTGAGGGILAVPALVYTQGWSMQQAMPVALLAVSCAALIGAVEGLMRKLVRYPCCYLDGGGRQSAYTARGTGRSATVTAMADAGVCPDPVCGGGAPDHADPLP